MTCNRCRKDFPGGESRCPRCGEPNPDLSGLFQTSTVFISEDGGRRVYRSVNEVPAQLRMRLLRTTHGANSATILIADRRGRQEIARAMRDLPGPAQRRLSRSILGAAGNPAGPPRWLLPGRKKAILAVIAMLTLALIAIVFTHRWQ